LSNQDNYHRLLLILDTVQYAEFEKARQLQLDFVGTVFHTASPQCARVRAAVATVKVRRTGELRCCIPPPACDHL
jgi:hypothetical protein